MSLKVVMAAASVSGVKLVVMEENRDQEVDELDQDRGRVVAGQYELVRTIFTYLPWKDLETSAKVGFFPPTCLLLLKYCPLSRFANCGKRFVPFVSRRGGDTTV